MNTGLVVAIAMALAFAFTNGVHDAANAIATLVMTRAARPGPAVVLAAVGNVVGPLLLGSAVASTIAGIVAVPSSEVIAVVGAALTGAVVVERAHLVARPAVELGSRAARGAGRRLARPRAGTSAVDWGGFDGIRPVGVIGVAVVLTVAPPLGFLAGLAADRGAHRAARTRHATPAGAGAGRPVGHVRGTGHQPRRQRRPEGGGRGRAPAGGRRSPVDTWPLRSGSRWPVGSRSPPAPRSAAGRSCAPSAGGSR